MSLSAAPGTGSSAPVPLSPGQTHLAVEHGPHQGVHGALGDEEVDVDRAALPDAVCSVLCLFDVAWVPVQLSKHNVSGSSEC